MAHDNDGLIRRYLLGELGEDELQQLEEKMMADNELFDRVLLAEDEMVEEYVQGELSESDRAGFEASFLSTPEGRQQVSFAKALSKYVKDVSPAPDAEVRVGEVPLAIALVAERPWAPGALTEEPLAEESRREGRIHRPAWWKRPALVPYFRLATAAVVVLALGLGIWWLVRPQSALSQGLASLNKAYQQQRPIEPRISGFDYAPASVTRGDASKQADTRSLNRAERILLDEVADHPSAASHHALGRLYLAEKKFDDAIKEFDEALKADPNNAQLHSDLGAALMERANASAQSDAKAEELGRALQHLDRALELNSSLFEALFNRALCLEAMMAYGQAEDAWTKYLEVDPSSPWAAEATKKLRELRERNRRSSDRETLFREFVAAFGASDKGQAWDVYSRTRYRTGHYFVEKLLQQFLDASTNGDRKTADAALAMLSFAGELDVERVGDYYLRDLMRYCLQSTVSQRAAVTHAREQMKSAAQRYDSNDFDGASDLFAKAAALYERNSDTCDALFARGWESFSLVRVPDTKTSLAMLEQLSPILLGRDYRWLYGQTLNAIADIENSRDNLSRALTYSEQSLKLAREINDPMGVLRNLSQSTSFYLQFGDCQKTLSKGFAGLETARTVPADAKQVWPLYYEMASAYLSLDSSSAALAFGKEALSLAIEAQFPLMEARSYARLGLIYRARSEYAEAMRYAQFAVDVSQRLSGRGALNTTAGATLSLAHLHRLTGSHVTAINLYDQAIALYKQLGLDIYGYEAHKGKLLSFIALGDDVAAATELPLTIKLYEEYRFKIAEESNKNRFFDTGNDLVDVAVAFEYSKQKNLQAAYDYAEASRARSLFDLITGKSSVVEGEGGPDNRLASHSRPLNLEQIRSRLTDDLQVLQYAVLDDKVICWVVSKQGFEARDSKVSASALDQMVHDYAGCLAGIVKADKADAVSKGKALFDILIRPVELLLDPNKIICIVPDKTLNYVPFPALISPKERYLIQDFRLQFSPSASVLLECTEMARARQRGTPERLLSVGDPDFDRQMFPSLPLLSSARVEAERIAEQYTSKRVLVGEEARKEEVKKELSQADVVQFATHYVPDLKSPMLSRLLLARPEADVESSDEGYLCPAEIYRMKLSRTRLVVLSGCQTGVEQTLRGEGAISVARPFLAAGVPLVVASLWSVETNSTKDLMIAFHSYRRVGLSTVDALRKAQLKMLDKGPNEVGHSFTWAAFEVIGGRSEF